MPPSATAPLDAGAVARALAPFGASRMLPGAAYVDPAVAAWEQDHFFDRGWVCAGRRDLVAEAGAQHATRVGTTGVLLVRDVDGPLRAFANICRHRGHELLPCGATATRLRIVCPYHAWSYGLDGRMRAAPRFGPLDAAELGLVRLRHHEWGGWVFVNVSGDAPPFDAAEHAGALVDLLAPWPLESLVPVATHRYDLAANWKLVHENYQECYHCPSIHPELCRVTVADSGANQQGGAWVGGTMDLDDGAETMSLDGRSGGVVMDGLPERERRTVTYVGLFPDLLISAHPDYVLTHRVEPVTPTSCRVDCQWLFPPAALDRPGFDPAYAVDFWDLVNRQDWAAVESVQRAVASPAYVPGPLGRHEHAVHAFVAMVARGYAGLPRARVGMAR